jgi:class 3 adenylate cyclase
MERLYALLDRYIAAAPEDRAPIEQEVWRTFGVERAVLALDMSGFSLSVRRTGIVPYLGQIRRMVRISRPLVEQHGGCVVKAEADNLLALFPTPLEALVTARAINSALAAERSSNPSPIPFAASIGIDFGKVLHIPGRDAFGDAVNIAYKLGEDIARSDEILVTQPVFDRLPIAEQDQLEIGDFSVSGLALTLWRIPAA